MKKELMKEVFNNYVKRFDLNNPYIKNRINHSVRVMNLSEELSKRLNLTEQEILLATLIGLYHDIGRFIQISGYRTLKDTKIDHGKLGIEVLYNDGLIEKLGKDDINNQIFEFAILNHNKLEIEKSDSDKIFFTQLVRDANAIDLLRSVKSKISVEKKKFDPYAKISERVKRTFFENKPINMIDIGNSNDMILSKISYIFDMNFSESLKILDDEELLIVYENDIYGEKIFKPYIEHAKKYIKKKIK